MRVGIGALVGVLGGPATYARELVAALARTRQDGDSYVVFSDRPDAFADLEVESVRVPLASTWHQATWDHWRLPGLIARARLDLYHGTKNVLPWRLPVPAVVTVHDLAVYAHPDTFAWPQRWHLRLLVPRAVAAAARVVADSDHARQDLLRRFRLPPEQVTAIPLGVPERLLGPSPLGRVAALRARHGLEGPLIACVGTVQPRKHVERVVAAFVESGAGAGGWSLVIAGRLRPGRAPTWLGALPPGAHWLGPLSDEDVHALYAAAEIAVSASEYEGFGLTVCEAMACGCAVLAVATSSLPEVVGAAGLLVPRSEVALLATALGRLVAEPDTRAALGAAARARAARFTWAETARRTRALYAEVVGRCGA